MVSNSSRIVKNTFFLYLRSFFVLLISLYTSRVILKVLGVEDYGIYNVVGGVIGMLSFLNSSMASTFQRFLNYEMGKKNYDGVSNLFKSSLSVQLIYALIIILLAETIGLWFFDNKLIIASERMVAAKWVYQISIISFVITVFQAPFTALIISYEKMSVFAIVSILDAILKLVIVIFLPFIDYDNLIVYAVLLLGTAILNFLLYVSICKRQFATCVINFNWCKNNLKLLLGFGGWGMMGSLAYTLKSQGINILLNMFFGPVVNAARGIAYQVLHAVEMFTTNFQTSFRPQLTKSYAEGDLSYMYKLYYSSTKISFFLLWCFSLPIIIETPMILGIWLGENVPEYTIVFTRLILLTALISAFANPTSAIAYATGKIKTFIFSVSALNLLIVPIAYLFLELGFGPASTMMVSLVMSVIVQIMRLFIIRKLVSFSIRNYFYKVVIPTFVVFISSSILSFLCKNIVPDCLIGSLFICFVAIICVLITVWIFGLNNDEKGMMLTKLRFIINRR